MERDTLADVVTRVARSLPSRSTVPILAGLLVNASGDEVALSSFDSTTSIQVTMPVGATDEGTVLIPGRPLNEITRSLPNRPIEMIFDYTQVKLICGFTWFSLRTLPVEEYPTLPEAPTQTDLVDASILEKSISQAVTTADRGELLSAFVDVRVEINGDRLSLLATNRYQMVLKEPIWQSPSPDIKDAVLAPNRALADTIKPLTLGKTATVSLSATESEGKGLVGFAGEGTKNCHDAATRPLNQAFPKARYLMDVVGTVTVRILTADLLAAVRRVSLVAECNTPLHMLIEGDHISLEAVTDDQTHIPEAIEAQVGVIGKEKSVKAAGFNPHYLFDALGTLDAPHAHFSLAALDKPCLITDLATVDGNQLFDYRHVIMFMHLSN